MANKLGSLVVSLGLDAAEFTRGMTKSEYEAKRSSDNIKAQFSGIATAVAGLGLGTLFVGGIRNALDYADQMGKLGQKAGVTSEEFSGLAYAANAADVSNEQLAKGLRALSKDAGDGGEKLALLGIKLDDASGKAKNADQLFNEVAQRFERMPDGIQKTTLAMALFGDKVGPELIPLLNSGAAGIKAMTDEASELGKVISDDVAKQADEFNDTLDRLKARADGFFIGVAGPIARGLNHVAEQFELARKYSSSFYESLFRTGTSNAPERIKDLQDKIKGLNAELKDPGLVGLPRARVEDAIASANKDLAMLGEFQRREQLADNARLGSQFGKNNPKLNSLAGRTDTYVPTVVATPKKDPRTGAPRTSIAEPAQRPDLELDAISADFAALDKQREERARRARQITEETLTPLEKLAATEAELDRLRRDGLITEEVLARARFDAAEAYDATQEKPVAQIKAIADGTDEAKEAAKSLGAAFTRTLDDAFKSGMKFGDLLKKLAFDALNVKVLTPAVQGAGSALASAFTSLVSSYDGGGYTGAGSRSGGLDGRGGFMAMLHPNETVLDHSRGQGAGGGTTIQQSITIDARGADAGVEQRIRAAMAQTKAETLASVRANVNRGGGWASDMGRA